MKYNYIINPLSNRKVSIYGKTGKRILANYVKVLFGGADKAEGVSAVAQWRALVGRPAAAAAGWDDEGDAHTKGSRIALARRHSLPSQGIGAGMREELKSQIKTKYIIQKIGLFTSCG